MYLFLCILAKLKILFIAYHILKPDTIFKDRVIVLQDVETTSFFHLHTW